MVSTVGTRLVAGILFADGIEWVSVSHTLSVCCFGS